MSATIFPYNDVLYDFWSGANLASHTYKLAFLDGAVHTASHATLAAVIAAVTGEVTNANVSAGGVTLTGVTLTKANTSGVKLDANDVSVAATASFGPYDGYVIYNDSRTGKPPICMVKLSSAVTIPSGQNIEAVFGSAGLINNNWG